jgi:tRNA threonylcarbamoyladenosine modification (KEOPS) complex  Pcc1 subunit
MGRLTGPQVGNLPHSRLFQRQTAEPDSSTRSTRAMLDSNQYHRRRSRAGFRKDGVEIVIQGDANSSFRASRFEYLRIRRRS